VSDDTAACVSHSCSHGVALDGKVAHGFTHVDQCT
jgi:hypothetical protein